MSACIEWPGGHWSTGYPYRMRHVTEEPGPRMIAVHREVWAKANGPIPAGLCVMHTCDNPGCINIEHLRVGTIADNQADMAMKKRGSNAKKSHCPEGHAYDRTGTRRTGRRAGKEYRWCSICDAARKGPAPRGRRNRAPTS